MRSFCIRLIFYSTFILTAHAENNKIKIKPKQIQALVLFFGEYKTVQEFNGAMGEQLVGILNESKDFKANTECEFKARFQEVLYKKTLHLKINFVAICDQVQTRLEPEYVRLKDLKVESSGFYLSEKHKNVQFKIVELKYK